MGNRIKTVIVIIGIVFWVSSGWTGCAGSNDNAASGGDADSDGDADTDSDGDTDTDADSDWELVNPSAEWHGR